MPFLLLKWYVNPSHPSLNNSFESDFPGGSDNKESTCNVGNPGPILGSEDPLEEGMATHSSILAWRIP